MRRISVVGAPGSGKTTVARRLARSLGVSHVELDGIFHQPGWAELPEVEFRRRVGGALRGDGWVVDGNYLAVQDLVWERADTVVWLDLPRPLALRRVVARTLRRVVTRQRLWNGNREPLANLYRLDPERSIIRWTWVHYPRYAQRYGAAMRDPRHGHLQFVRLRSRRDVAVFLASR